MAKTAGNLDHWNTPGAALKIQCERSPGSKFRDRPMQAVTVKTIPGRDLGQWYGRLTGAGSCVKVSIPVVNTLKFVCSYSSRCWLMYSSIFVRFVQPSHFY